MILTHCFWRGIPCSHTALKQGPAPQACSFLGLFLFFYSKAASDERVCVDVHVLHTFLQDLQTTLELFYY